MWEEADLEVALRRRKRRLRTRKPRLFGSIMKMFALRAFSLLVLPIKTIHSAIGSEN